MKNKLLSLSLILLLTSCGAYLDKAVPSKIDHSGTWLNNYYTNFDSSLKEKTVEDIVLKADENKVFTTFGGDNFKTLQLDYEKYLYGDYDTNKSFGENFKLSKVNEEIKDGFVSKLFDGQLFCNGDYEKARIQINENGFSSPFYKELESASYLYLHFKSAIDFKSPGLKPASHLDTITLNITFYKEDKGYNYTYQLSDVPTNAGETYIFYGFSLEGFDLTGMKDFSISYKLDYDIIKESYPDLNHALLLYEFSLVNAKFK